MAASTLSPSVSLGTARSCSKPSESSPCSSTRQNPPRGPDLASFYRPPPPNGSCSSPRGLPTGPPRTPGTLPPPISARTSGPPHRKAVPSEGSATATAHTHQPWSDGLCRARSPSLPSPCAHHPQGHAEGNRGNRHTWPTRPKPLTARLPTERATHSCSVPYPDPGPPQLFRLLTPRLSPICTRCTGSSGSAGSLGTLYSQLTSGSAAQRTHG